MYSFITYYLQHKEIIIFCCYYYYYYLLPGVSKPHRASLIRIKKTWKLELENFACGKEFGFYFNYKSMQYHALSFNNAFKIKRGKYDGVISNKYIFYYAFKAQHNQHNTTQTWRSRIFIFMFVWHKWLKYMRSHMCFALH